jgi:hypothetical protein
MRDLLGGKGANLAEMTRVLGADRVPAGSTITTEACAAYLGSGGEMPEDSTPRSVRLWRGWSGARVAHLGILAIPAGLGALGRQDLDARHARHGPQPGTQCALKDRFEQIYRIA